MKIICILLLDMCCLISVYAQWQPDVRLTNNAASSQSSYNNARCIAGNGDDVRVVWYDNRDGNFEIYYKRSTDGGGSWQADTRLTSNSSMSWLPSVAVSGPVLHVVWEDLRDGGGNQEVYYKCSTDGGSSWGVDTRLTFSGSTGNPSVAASGSVVHVVWYDQRDSGNTEVYYKRSIDGGLGWGSDTRLTNSAGASWRPSLSVSGSTLHAVWHDERDGNPEIYCKRSTDGGSSWGADTRLTNNAAGSAWPSVSVSDFPSSVVHVVWVESRDGNFEIYYKRSTDGGVSWQADTRLTNNSSNSLEPSVSASGLNVHVVWYDARNGGYEIYYKRSLDGGLTWEPDTRLTNNLAISQNPSISVSGSVVHVLWFDERDGNSEIYYKRDATGNPVGVKEIDPDDPREFKLEQNYPNPFNPSTTINYQLPTNSYVSLKVFDMLGREVATLVNEVKQPGTYTEQWDASGSASGVYCYLLSAGQSVAVKKLLLLR